LRIGWFVQIVARRVARTAHVMCRQARSIANRSNRSTASAAGVPDSGNFSPSNCRHMSFSQSSHFLCCVGRTQSIMKPSMSVFFSASSTQRQK